MDETIQTIIQGGILVTVIVIAKTVLDIKNDTNSINKNTTGGNKSEHDNPTDGQS